jgi:hypothetical protein
MNLILPCIGAHPGSGEEVMVMDDAPSDVEVHVCRMSISRISSLEERMGER